MVNNQLNICNITNLKEDSLFKMLKINKIKFTNYIFFVKIDILCSIC